MNKPNTIGSSLLNFKPDVHMIIKHDSATGQTMLESGNGRPINPLFLCTLLTGVIKGNLDALLQAQLKMTRNQPHKFLALPGEVKCRHPYCVEPEDAPIHIKEEQ